MLNLFNRSLQMCLDKNKTQKTNTTTKLRAKNIKHRFIKVEQFLIKLENKWKASFWQWKLRLIQLLAILQNGTDADPK